MFAIGYAGVPIAANEIERCSVLKWDGWNPKIEEKCVYVYIAYVYFYVLLLFSLFLFFCKHDELRSIALAVSSSRLLCSLVLSSVCIRCLNQCKGNVQKQRMLSWVHKEGHVLVCRPCV